MLSINQTKPKHSPKRRQGIFLFLFKKCHMQMKICVGCVQGHLGAPGVSFHWHLLVFETMSPLVWNFPSKPCWSAMRRHRDSLACVSWCNNQNGGLSCLAFFCLFFSWALRMGLGNQTFYLLSYICSLRNSFLCMSFDRMFIQNSRTEMSHSQENCH